MKYIIAAILIVIISGIFLTYYSQKNNSQLDSYTYKTLKTYSQFEIRAYESSLFTTVTLPPTDFKTTSSKGFKVLAGYIFGDNSKNEKIAMTSPVAMTLEDSTTMMFMVPKNLSKDKLPSPNNDQIKFKVEPKKTVAAITFGGWADDKVIEKNKKILLDALQTENIVFENKFYYLGYNPPYEIINRRNEIIVELKLGENEDLLNSTK